ncbi:MAG: M20 family metallopeptidase [Acidobacteria bacterium]|nr:M20 family metallopeptidase [Acidobacteriota bacterium]
MLEMLRELVEMESPSTDKAAVDRCGEHVAAIAREMGGRVQLFPSRHTGNALRAEFAAGAGKRPGQILLLGHLDTVWEKGTIERMPFRVRGGKAYGPGALDMKSGIVAGLFALRALRLLGIPLQKKVVLLLGADEEIGSGFTRRVIENEARKSDAVLVLEPAQGAHGALKTARKGVGEFQILVRGRAAHAGLEPEKGASAIVELSRQILLLEQLAEPRRGITLNAGVIQGGTRTNVVAEQAVARVDVRVKRIEDLRRIEAKLRALREQDRRTKIEVSGGFNRPPLERTPGVAALFQLARRLAKPLGLALQEAAVGGGSDGNFTAALGVATLDGLGAVGEGAHSRQEHIIVTELPRRAALLAHLIASVASLRSLPPGV